MGAQVMDGLGDRLFAAFLAENPLIDPLVLLGSEIGFGNMKAAIRWAV
jgi:hypothetical protein